MVVVVAARLALAGVEDERHPEIGWLTVPLRSALGELEGLRHDADDRVGLSRQYDSLAEDVSRAEPPLPQAMTQHDHARVAGVVREKHSAARRRDAEQRKYIPGNLRGDDLLGCIPARQLERPKTIRPDFGERTLLADNVLEVGRGEAPSRNIALREALVQHHEAFGVGVAERANQCGVDQAEDGAVRANTQGECPDRHQREHGRSQEPTHGVSNVEQQRAHGPVSRLTEGQSIDAAALPARREMAQAQRAQQIGDDAGPGSAGAAVPDEVVEIRLEVGTVRLVKGARVETKQAAEAGARPSC